MIAIVWHSINWNKIKFDMIWYDENEFKFGYKLRWNNFFLLRYDKIEKNEEEKGI